MRGSVKDLTHLCSQVNPVRSCTAGSEQSSFECLQTTPLLHKIGLSQDDLLCNLRQKMLKSFCTISIQLPMRLELCWQLLEISELKLKSLWFTRYGGNNVSLNLWSNVSRALAAHQAQNKIYLFESSDSKWASCVFHIDAHKTNFAVFLTPEVFYYTTALKLCRAGLNYTFLSSDTAALEKQHSTQTASKPRQRGSRPSTWHSTYPAAKYQWRTASSSTLRIETWPHKLASCAPTQTPSWEQHQRIGSIHVHPSHKRASQQLYNEHRPAAL